MANVRLSNGTVLRIPEGLSVEERLDIMRQADPGAFPKLTAGDIAKETLKNIPRGLMSVPEMGFKGLGAIAETHGGGGTIGDTVAKALRYTGEAFGKVSEDMLGPRGEASEKFIPKVGEAIGQIGGFMASAGLAGPVAPFVAGSAMMAEEAYQDIQKYAHTEDEKASAVAWGAFFGTTEAVPIWRALDRLGKPVKHRLLGALVKGGKAGLEEAVQEATQQGLMNFSASDLVGYDKDRELLDGLGEAAAVGGTAGFVANLFLAALTGGRRSVKPAKPEDSARERDPERTVVGDTTAEGVTLDPKEVIAPSVIEPEADIDIPVEALVVEGERRLPARLVTVEGDTLTDTVRKQLRASLVPTEHIREEQLDQQAEDIMQILRARASSAQESLDQYIFNRGLTFSNIAYDWNAGQVILQPKGFEAHGSINNLTHLEYGAVRAISLFQQQKASTVIHELGHLFSRDLRGAELAVVNKWLGYDPQTTSDKWEAEVEGKGHEMFARAFERYLHTEKVPGNDSGLRTAFNRIKEVMRRVYAVVKGSPIDYQIPKQVTKVFDKLMKPDGMPTFQAPSQMTYENWRAFQGNMMADLSGVTDGAMAVARPTYTQTLMNNIRRSIYYSPAQETAGRLAIMKSPETGFLTNASLSLEEKLNRSVMLLTTEATHLFHQKESMAEPLQTLETTLENRQAELPQQVLSQIQSAVAYIKRLGEYRELQDTFRTSLRAGLLRVQEEVGEPILIERMTGKLYRTVKEGRAGGRIVVPLDGIDRRYVRVAEMHSDFISPEVIQSKKDWTTDRETYILEKHRELIDEALMEGKELPSHALLPHRNADPVYENAYNDAVLREEPKRKLIEQRKIVEEWKADVEATPNPPVEMLSQVNMETVQNLKADEVGKKKLLTIAGFVDQSYYLLERLSNTLDKDTRIKFLDVVPKAELQRLTALRGDVGAHTARDYLANLFTEMDAVKESLEKGDIDVTNQEQLAVVLDRVQAVHKQLDTWEKRFKESGQADMLEPGKTESQLNKIWDWFERTVPFIPERAGGNTIAMGVRKAVMTMHWMSRRFPVLLPLYRLGSTHRFINATLQTNQLLNGMEQAETIEITTVKGEVQSVTVQAPGLRTFRDIPNRGPVYVALQHLLLTSDQMEKRFTQEELNAILDKASEVKSETETRALTRQEKDAIIRAYGEVQGTMEYMYYKLYQTLERQFGDKRAASVLNTLYPKGYIEGYFPHVRSGKYAAVVKDPTTGETKYFGMYDRAIDQKAALNRLREKNPGMNVSAVDPTDRINYQYGGGVDLITAIKDVIAKADIQSLTDNPEQAAEIEKALDTATAAIIKSHGMFSMFGERRNIPGFDERINHVIIKRVHDFGSAIAKVEFAKKGTDELTKLRSTPQIYNYAQDWFGAMLRHGDHHDAMVGKIRSLIFFKYLGFNIKTAFVVFADKITNAPARLGLHTQGADKKLVQGMGKARKFMSWLQDVEKLAKQEGILRDEAMKRIPIPEGLTQEKINALLWSRDAGVSTAKFVPEILNQEETTWEVGAEHRTTKYGRTMDIASTGMQKAFNASSWMLHNVESFNRLSTFLTGFEVFRHEKGFSYDDAILNAEELVNDSHFLYGKPNIPMLFHRPGLGKWLRTFYTFRSYEHNYIQMLGDLMYGKGRRGKLMAAKSLVYLMALGGVPAVPFFTALSKALGVFTGDDPEREVLNKLYQMDAPDFLAQSFSDGIPGMFGTTFRGSLQVGAYENMEEIISGVAGSFARDITGAMKDVYHGNWEMAARKLMPTAAANIYKAIEGREHGVMSAYGTPLREEVIGPQIKYTEAEFLQKVLSFNPQREAATHRVKKAMRTSDEHWRNRRQIVYAKFARAIRTNDKAGMAAAFMDVQSYERDRLGQGAIDVPAIDRQSLQRSLEESGLRRREILQVLRVTGRLHGM